MEENPYLHDFAVRLNALREVKGVSAREMSLDMGQAHSFIHGIENERNFPTMLNFFYICEYLEVSPQEFFNYKNQNPEEMRALLREFQKLDPTSRSYLLGLMRELNKKER